MGLAPTSIPLSFNYTNFPNVQEHLKNLQNYWLEAQSAHELARQRIMARIQGSIPPFKQGDQVWLDSRNLKVLYASKKLAARRQGPFKTTKTLGLLTYRLQLSKSWKIHNVFHATLLSPFTETEVHGPNFPQSPPDLIDGEEEYEVEAILNHRWKRRGTEYYVKWAGYGTGEESWVKEKDLENIKEVLDAYKAKARL